MKRTASVLGLILVAFFFLAAGKPAGSLEGQLKKAKAFEARGKYLQAREIYETILKESKQKNAKIQKAYESLNVKLLLSKTATPESEIYTVKEGDRLLELAQKYHTTRAVLIKSNKLKDEKIFSGMKLKVPKGMFSIQVDKSSNLLTLYLDKKAFKHYRVATGVRNVTPAGDFKIANKVKNPTWYKAGAVIPPGVKENFLGTRWLGFDYPGYGIHGTLNPETIGQQVSSGCIRMRNQDVEELYDLIPLGIKVTIKD